jgi:hypothetical protein
MFLEAIASRRLRLAANGLTPHKAKIINLSSKKTFLNNKIEVSFNPQTIKFKACPIYKEENVPGAPMGVRTTFSGNMASKLSMTLLFDTTMTGDNVREKYIDFLVELTVPIKERPTAPEEPPLCRFHWGEFSQDPYLGFDAVLDELHVDYIWFLPNGLPVRATTEVTFKQPDKIRGGTNPTSRSEARRVWRVIEGQTLDWIAYQEYGDSEAWRHIARTNNLRNPRDLRPGMVLNLLPLP